MTINILTRQVLTKECKNSKSFSQIGEKYGIDRHIISEYCHKFNIKPSLPKRRRYLVNDNFFQNATEKSFYWAGFIAADGCLVRDHSVVPNVLHIELSKKDKGLLKHFANDIEFTGPISTRTPKRGKGDLVKLSIFSNSIIKDLKKFNITPKKSLTLKFPKHIINHPLVSHFMRGYFDGDGCFYIHKKNKRTTMIILGTFNFLKIFSQIIEKHCNLLSSRKPRKPASKSNVYELRFYRQQDIKNIVDFIYKNSITFLPRKRKIVKSFLADHRKKKA